MGHGRRPRPGWGVCDGAHRSGDTVGRPVREPLALPRLSPRVRMEMPLKLLAFVTGGLSVRLELSESVLLQGRGSRLFTSLSVLL